MQLCTRTTVVGQPSGLPLVHWPSRLVFLLSYQPGRPKDGGRRDVRPATGRPAGGPLERRRDSNIVAPVPPPFRPRYARRVQKNITIQKPI